MKGHRNASGKTSRWQKKVAVLLVLVQVTSIVPAQELSMERRKNLELLEYYFDRADLEQDGKRWNMIAESGILSAISEWEDSAISEMEKEKIKDEYDEEKKRRYGEWLLKRHLDEERSKSIRNFKESLRNAANEWTFQNEEGIGTDKIKQSQVDSAWSQWTDFAEDIAGQNGHTPKMAELERLLQDSELGEDARRDLIQMQTRQYNEYLKVEMELVSCAEGSRIISGMLYDRSSLKRMSADEAASFIATELAAMAEENATGKTKDLMDDFNSQLESPDVPIDDELAFYDGWSETLSRRIDEAIAEWEEAELKFLVERTEWERNAEQVYLESERSWADAFSELRERRKEWESSLLEQIDSGLLLWQTKNAELEEQISTARMQLEQQLAEERNQLQNMLDIYFSSYNQSRQLLSVCAQGIDGWFKQWTQEYRDIYEYCERNAENPDEMFLHGRLDGVDTHDNSKDDKPYECDIADYSTIAGAERTYKQLNEWKDAYIFMIRDKIEKKIDSFSIEADSAEKQIERLEGLIEDAEYKLSKLPPEGTYGVDLNELRAEKNILTSSIKDMKESIVSLGDRISTLEESAKKAESVLKSLENVSCTSDSEQIEVALAEYAGLFKQALWESSESMTDLNTGWIPIAVRAQENRQNAVSELYTLHGSILAQESDHMDTMELEYLKSVAALEHWQQELAALESLNQYIMDSSSQVEGMEQTQKALEESAARYKEATERYGQAVANVQQAAQRIQAEQKSLDELMAELQERQTALDKARDEHQNLLATLDGIDEDYVKEQIEHILTQIKAAEEDTRYANSTENYYVQYKEYSDFMEAMQIQSITTRLQTGGNGMIGVGEIESLINEAEEYILMLGTDLKKITLYDFAKKVEQEVPLAASVIAQYLQIGENSTEEESLYAQEAVENSLKLIIAYYDNELKMRAESIKYIEGYEEDSIWNTSGKTEATQERQEDKGIITQLETLISQLENNTQERKRQVTQTYGSLRQEYKSQERQMAIEDLETKTSSDFKTLGSLESLLDWAATISCESEGVGLAEKEALSNYVALVVKYHGLKSYYAGQERVQDASSMDEYLQEATDEYMKAQETMRVYQDLQYKQALDAALFLLKDKETAGLSQQELETLEKYIACHMHSLGEDLEQTNAEYTELEETVRRNIEKEKEAFRQSQQNGDLALLQQQAIEVLAQALKKQLNSFYKARLYLLYKEAAWNESCIDFVESVGKVKEELDGIDKDYKDMVQDAAAYRLGIVERDAKIHLDAFHGLVVLPRSPSTNDVDMERMNVLVAQINSYKLSSEDDLKDKVKQLNDLTGYLEKNRMTTSELEGKLKALEDALKAAQTQVEAAEVAVLGQRSNINHAMQSYNTSADTADSAYGDVKEAALERRKAQEKHDWAMGVYLDGASDEEKEGISQAKRRLEEARKSVDAYSLSVSVLKSFLEGERTIEDAEYLDKVDSYREQHENHYTTLVLQSVIAQNIMMQEETTREAETAEKIARAYLTMEHDMDGGMSGSVEMVRIAKTAAGYEIKMAYRTEVVSSAYTQVTHEDGSTEYVTKNEWQSKPVSSDSLQDNVAFAEYFDTSGVEDTSVDGVQTRSMAQEECNQWLEKMAGEEDGYLNDVMLAALHVMSHMEDPGKYLGNHVDITDEGTFSSDMLPDVESFHGLDLKEKYLYSRENVLAQAYERVAKKSGGEEDMARYILYRATVLAEGNAWQQREQALVEEKALREISNTLEKRENTSQIAAEVNAILAASLTIAAIPFCWWLLVGAAAAAAIAAWQYDVAESYEAARNQVDQLVHAKENVADRVEEDKKNAVERWISARNEMEFQREKLNAMYNGGSSEAEGDISYESYMKAMALMLEGNKVVGCEETRQVVTEEIFAKACTGGAKTTVQATKAISDYLEEEKGEAYSALSEHAAALAGKQEDGMESYSTIVDELRQSGLTAESRRRLEQAVRTAGRDWNAKEHEKNLALTEMVAYNTKVDGRSTTELHTETVQDSIKERVLEAHDMHVKNVVAAAGFGWQQLRDDLGMQKEKWLDQMQKVNDISTKEWNKAQENMNAEYALWRKGFVEEYNKLSKEWNAGLTDFLEEKERWIYEQYTGAATKGARQAAQEAVRKASTTGVMASVQTDEYVDKIIESRSLKAMMRAAVNLQSGAMYGGTTQVCMHAAKDFKHMEAQERALASIRSMSLDMEAAAGKFAGTQYRQMLEETAGSYLDRLALENEAMEEWQETLALNNGYRLDGVITRQVVVDATLMNPIEERQTMHRYERLKVDNLPDITINSGLEGSQLMQSAGQAQRRLEQWAERLFGEGFLENKTQYWQVDRQSATSGEVELLRKRQQEMKDSIGELEKLSRKRYEDMSEEEKDRYRELGNEIVSVRDGELGRHIGFAPVLREEADPNGKKQEAVEQAGSGQMGLIMLDFQWNSLRARQGMAELSKAGYDKRLWDDRDSSFKAPTLREAMNIAMSIVGNATGQVWLDYLDDALFATLDIGGGYKSAAEVGMELAKTGISAVAGAGIGAVGDKFGNMASNAMAGAGKFANVAVQAGISMGTNYVTSAANNAINSFYIGQDGKLAFDTDTFTKSLYSAGTISSMVGSGVTSGFNAGINTKLVSMGDQGAAIQKFYGSAINLGVSAASKASEYAVYSAYALSQGRTLSDAYDDMGGLTFNVASIGVLTDMLASREARNNATGQAGNSAAGQANATGQAGELVTITRRPRGGTGLLEINIGAKGITGKIGTNGIDLAGSLYTLGKRMKDKGGLENYAKRDGTSQEEAATAYWSYVYGDWTQENTAARIASGIDELNIVDKMQDGALAQTIQNTKGTGRLMTITSTGDNHLNAVQLGHEAYRDGIKGTLWGQQIETYNAVAGHAGMAARMTSYGRKFGGLLGAEVQAYRQGDMAALMIDSVKNYDSSADYWKLMDDGSIAYDGRADLYDENDNLIYQTKKRGLEGSFIEILYGENATTEQKKAAIDLLEKNFSHYVKGGDASNRDNWYWDTKENEGKSMSVDQYEEIYKTRILKDGFEATIEQHNPYNIYLNMVANGTMDLRPGMAESATAAYYAGDNKYISYEEFKANNYITGGMPEFQANDTFSDKEVVTLVGATGNISSYPHRGIDTSTLPTDSLPLLFNDGSYVSNIGDEKDSFQGYHVDVTTTLSYVFKGKSYKDEILYRTLHLSEINVKEKQLVLEKTVLGKTGNTGEWNGVGYGYHAHEDISTSKPSPYLDYLTNKTENVSNRIYHNGRYYYDKFLFVDKSKYNIAETANTYNW